MKLNKFENYFPNRELGNLADENIYDTIITITEVHKIKARNVETDELEDRIIFICKEIEDKYYFMPSSFNDSFTDDSIEAINNGVDSIKGSFKKVNTKNGRKCWNFTDVE